MHVTGHRQAFLMKILNNSRDQNITAISIQWSHGTAEKQSRSYVLMIVTICSCMYTVSQGYWTCILVLMTI
jgi:hypothetical protein